jgi:cytochrome P450
VLRFDSPVQGLTRTLTRDVELHGHRLRRGERVHLLFAAANRDERCFAEPDRFEIGRDPNPHLAFGFGVHFCLGASLARLELRVALEELLARAPGYSVTDEKLLRVRSDTNRLYARLPVALA